MASPTPYPPSLLIPRVTLLPVLHATAHITGIVLRGSPQNKDANITDWLYEPPSALPGQWLDSYLFIGRLPLHYKANKHDSYVAALSLDPPQFIAIALIQPIKR